MNDVRLTGRLATDPKYTYYKSDVEAGISPGKRKFMVYFELAVARKRKNKKKDGQDVDWIPISFFHGSSAKFIRKYIRKGDAVAIVGELEASVYKQENGQDKKNIRVIGCTLEIMQNIRKDRKTGT